ncbi:hypothetical protein SAMN02799624_03723 [Paenibacillus sp. UNC496MF]|uniref:hypothetical protein n=1 Tax=Paenibacillus sp. UNC496MF TaxID=1502753 RepID=UPI0008E875DB|nr:hypothetical protein [Paenibacillus sp. UNC496MF]SFJ22973.1 hypothetical protein SAMN02799624_03723 [Paenibacillus sp. UNC496MF]
MKKWLLTSVVLASVLAVSACGNTNSNDPAASNASSGSNATNTSNASNGTNGSGASGASNASNGTNNTNGSNANAPADESASTPAYFGDWTVKGVAGSTAVSTAPDDSMIGTKATYASDKAVFGKDEIQKPEYKEEELAKGDFASEYRVQLKDLGIDADSVKAVTIGDGASPGSFFVVKDAQTLLVLWDGNFYELQKAA